MKNEIFLSWQKILFVFGLVTLFSLGTSFNSHAQSPPGISINWDKEVGCQTYDIKRDKENEIFSEDIDSSDCIRFCEYSQVTYTLVNVPAGATILWNPIGGTTSNNTSLSCIVNWGAAGNGSLSYTITDGNNIINKTICIEKVITPKAEFDVAPFGQQPIEICSYQQIDFTNLSTTNNGTNLISYEWDFGDGNTSTAFEPSHTYTNPGGYVVKLTVRNECNCTDTYAMKVEVGEKGFEITCPTVICEGQSGIYSLPQHIVDQCNGSSNWSVIGGQIVSQSNGQVEVLWDNIDPSGFGYVTFDPSGCAISCGQPTTVKVPVVQMNGTIQGLNSICIGEQGRYKLPQWPTTDINWEIVGNVGGSLGTIIQTDQRNEVIVEPTATGQIVLRATYTNTLLGCSGEAEITIDVEEPITVSGEDILCKNSSETYTNSTGSPVNWELVTNAGTVVATQNNSLDFNYTFNQAGTFILSANDAGYCEGEQKIITVLETPDAPTGVDGDLLVCPSSPYSYSVQNPDPSSNYIWEVDNGNTLSSNEGDQVNITFDGTLPAEVKVYKQSLTPIECLSDPFVFNVNQIPIDVEISDDALIVCASSEESYSAYELNTTNLYTEGDDYTWSFENASPSGIPASSLGSVTNGQGTNMVDITWNNVPVVTTVDLVLEVSKCNISPTPKFTQQITINPQTEIDLTASPDPVCSGSPVTFTVQSSNGPLTGNEIIEWKYGNDVFTGIAGQTSYDFTMESNATTNVGQIVTAELTNPSCGQPYTATTTVTVLPNPPVVASLTSGDSYYCDANNINAVITVSSNTTSLTNFQWLHNNSPISGQTGTSITVTPTMMGAGEYKFQATNANGCVTVSNPVFINVDNCGTGCTLPHTVTNTSSLTDCGEITFSGTATSGGVSSWSVISPSSSEYTRNGNILEGKPGMYTIAHDVTYPCPGGSGVGTIREIEQVVIPYIADFSYVVECTPNNTFNINFIDESIFYAPVTSQQVNFFYRQGSNSYQAVPYDPSLSVFEISNLSPGSYEFKQEVDGVYNGVAQTTCVQEFTVSLQGVNPNIDVIISNLNQYQQINCHDTPVEFDLFPQALGSSILWDFDDNGAQNTLPSPKRVFTTPDETYNVTATVTNELGCVSEFTTPVTIPEECFFGDITSSPSPAEVCQNETVDITYVPNGDNCPVDEYIWMDGNTPVPGAPHGATLTVSSTGFYWVKVVSQDGCEHSSPTQIKPVFKTLPNVKLIGESTVCIDADMIYTVSTNASTIEWFIDGTPYSQFDDMTEADFTGQLSTGNYTVSVEVTATNGCTNTATMDITVADVLSNISFNTSYQCAPYQVEIEAITTPSNSNVIYNWSNGATGQTIVVPDGGPYQVTASLGGCSISEEIDIPRHPDSYMWIFPSGCYTECIASVDVMPNYLIGPTLPLPDWSWNDYGGAMQSGSGTFQSPFNIPHSGSYSSTLNTGPCELESDPLEYSLTDCEKCEIEGIEIGEIVENSTPYCSFTYNVTIWSNATFTATISENFNNVTILPSTVNLVPGPNNIQFTIIPQGSYISGGTAYLTIQGTMWNGDEYVDCIYELVIEIPPCSSSFNARMIDTGAGNSSDAMDILNIHPNPAKDMATVSYELSSDQATLEVYDLAGRGISRHAITNNQGTVHLNTSSYEAGVYVVVVRQKNGYTMQQKLVIE